MRKFWLTLIFIFCLGRIYALTSISEFELLGPEEKVDTLLQEYYGNQWFGFRLDFARKASRIADEADKTLPYILSLLRKYDARPCSSGKNEIEILDNIIEFKFFQVKKLSNHDLEELGSIYTDLLDTYLREYKRIDSMAMVLEINLIKFTRGLYTPRSLKWVERMYEKYVALGYEDLVIDYEELTRLSGLK